MMSQLSFAQIVAMARDIAFLALLAAVPVLGLLVYRKVRAALKAVRRVKTLLENIGATMSRSFVKPASSGPKAAPARRMLSPRTWFRRQIRRESG